MLNMDFLTRLPTIQQQFPVSILQAERTRELTRSRARHLSTAIRIRSLLPENGKVYPPIVTCNNLISDIYNLNTSLSSSMDSTHQETIKHLSTTLSSLETQQSSISEKVHSSLNKTRTETAVQINDIADEQTSILLLQLKAVEDKMDALEYRTKSGWNHEKTLRLIFLVLEYVVMVVLWLIWVLISGLRWVKRGVVVLWIFFWGIIFVLYRVVKWLFFLS
jgi:hypothetical protein